MDKRLVMFGMTVGSLLGAYIPVWFGASSFSFTSILGAFIGGAFGILIVVKLYN